MAERKLFYEDGIIWDGIGIAYESFALEHLSVEARKRLAEGLYTPEDIG